MVDTQRDQRRRRLTQTIFFLLFVLAPVFDIFRYDLSRDHAYFLGMEWRLGLDALMAGAITPAEAAWNVLLRLFLPLLGVAGLFIGVAWKWGRLYCGWLCPHFSVVETINRLMILATGKHSLWEHRSLPARQPDGTTLSTDVRGWFLVLPFAVGFAFLWALVFLTYLMPPMEIYERLLTFHLHRHERLFLVAGTLVLSLEFLFARHLFCKYACAVGMFQSLAWMGNRQALVVGVDRLRLAECADCLEGEGSACEAVCPMRLRPRSIKRLMFSCTQCVQCVSACTTVQQDNPRGSLLTWVQKEAASQNEGGFKAPRPGTQGKD